MIHQIREVIVSGRHVPTVILKNEPDVFYVIGPMYAHGPFKLDDNRFRMVCKIKLKKKT